MVDRFHMDWVCIIIGTTTLVVAADSTPMTDEQTTRVMDPIHDDMNRILCIVSSEFGGGGISIMGACVRARLDSSFS